MSERSVLLLIKAKNDIYRDRLHQEPYISKGFTSRCTIYGNTKMSYVKQKISEDLWSLPMEAFMFTYKGKTILDNDTYDSLEMHHSDEILVIQNEDWFPKQESTLIQDLKKAYLAKKNYDIIVKVGSKKFYLHSFILVARSTKFASEIKKGQTSLELPNLDSNVFSLFIQYLYEDDIQLQNVPLSQVILLFSLAGEHQLPHLQQICENKMVSLLTLENALELNLLSTRLVPTPFLKYSSFSLLSEKIDELICDEEFCKKISKENLIKIFRVKNKKENTRKRRRIPD
jgi:hypothetical protein